MNRIYISKNQNLFFIGHFVNFALLPKQSYKELLSFYSKYKPIIQTTFLGLLTGLLIGIVSQKKIYIYFYEYDTKNTALLPDYLINDTFLTINKNLSFSNYHNKDLELNSSERKKSEFKIYSNIDNIKTLNQTIKQTINNKYVNYLRLSYLESYSISSSTLYYGILGFFIGTLIFLYLKRNGQQ